MSKQSPIRYTESGIGWTYVQAKAGDEDAVTIKVGGRNTHVPVTDVLEIANALIKGEPTDGH